MAAIDPTAEPEIEGDATSVVPRATLKIIRQPIDFDDEDSEDEEEYLQSLINGEDSDEDDDEDEDESNGGPSDPAKSKKALKNAALQKLLANIGPASDDEMDISGSINGAKDKKGKAKATEDDDEDDDDEEEDDSDDDMDIEEFVVCTLDPEKVMRFFLYLSTLLT
jgi:FK506-binding nuclear protein